MSIEIFKTRVSGRDYDGKELSKEEFNEIKEIINNAPTSTNGQQFSAIVVTDKESLEWFSKLNWGQPHFKSAQGFILVLADRTRQNIILEGKDIHPDFKDHEQYRAIVDATIGATYIHDALMVKGKGVCFMGGAATNAKEIMERYNLPETVFPVVGITFGNPTKENEFKPKINKTYLNSYPSREEMKQEIDEYDEEIKEYYMSRRPGASWKHEQIKTNGHDVKPGYTDSFKKGSVNVQDFRKNFK